MKRIANLLFEARKLKHIPRSGYQFLEIGRESVAEHCFLTAFIAFVMVQSLPDMDSGTGSDPAVNPDRLVRMCLFHDFAEARTGDMNYVQKPYVAVDERRALADAFGGIAFGPEIMDLLEEFRRGETLEARLAKDADQLSLLLDLKAMEDLGCRKNEKWTDNIYRRLKTQQGKTLFHEIIQTHSDDWWLHDGLEASGEIKE
jgi:putative hydrolases of HD superfamily